MTDEIYVYETMDAEEAVAKAKELRDSLYKYRKRLEER